MDATATAVKIFSHTFHRSALIVFVLFNRIINTLIPISNGNIKNAYGQDQDMVAIVVHPPSTTGNDMPVADIIAWAAGFRESFMKLIIRFIPVKATASVIPDEIASLTFILTINPAMIIINGTNTDAPRPRKKFTI